MAGKFRHGPVHVERREVYKAVDGEPANLQIVAAEFPEEISPCVHLLSRMGSPIDQT